MSQTSKDEDHTVKPLKDFLLDTMVCTHCGFCKSVCPGFQLTRNDTRTPRAKVMLSYGILNHDFEPDESVMEAIYTCSTCMDCTRRCPSNVKTLDLMMAARKEMARRGLIPEGAKAAVANIERVNNPGGESVEKRTDFIPEEALARVGKGAPTLVYVGCVTSYNDMKMASNLFKVMEKAKLDYTYFGKDEPCCGMLNYLMGYDVDGFAKVMKEKLDALEPRPTTVVTPCPGCFRSWSQNYNQYFDLKVDVKHTVQYFLDLLESGKLKVKKKLEGKVFYHDPCDLGRHAGIYEEPRKLLSYFAEVHEFPHHHEEARCCGGGGGLQAVNFEVSAGIAKTRMMEALGQGADVVVSACPGCKNTLSSVVPEIKKETGKKMKVMDLTDIVAKYTTGTD